MTWTNAMIIPCGITEALPVGQLYRPADFSKPHTLFLQALADRSKQLFGGLLPLERRIIFGRDRFLLQEQRRPLIQLLAACR